MNLLCATLGVSRSGFCAWISRLKSKRSHSNEVRGAKVFQSFMASDRTYGARLVWRDVLELGYVCGLHRIKLGCATKHYETGQDAVGFRLIGVFAPSSLLIFWILDRQFETSAPNQKCVSHFAYIWTAEGWRYVAVVLDLTLCVPWVDPCNRAWHQLVADALMMAFWLRGKPDQLLHHSDQGSQFTSNHFQRLLAEQGIVCSMSRGGGSLG